MFALFGGKEHAEGACSGIDVATSTTEGRVGMDVALSGIAVGISRRAPSFEHVVAFVVRSVKTVICGATSCDCLCRTGTDLGMHA